MRQTRQAIPQRDALRYQLAASVGGHRESLLELRFKLRSGGMGQEFLPASQLDRAATMIEARGRTTDVYFGVAPRSRAHGGKDAVPAVNVVWADCDGPDAVRALAGFSPWPAIVVRTGSGPNVHAYWCLRKPIAPGEAEDANRRLALHLGADVRATDAARVLRPAGTWNHKTQPPQPVVCTRLEFAGRSPELTDVLDAVPELPAPEPPVRLPRRIRESPYADVLQAIPIAEAVEVLTGQAVGRDGKARCPVHAGGRERTPSLHIYTDGPGPGSWFCFGCKRGGSLIDFGALLYGLEPRGRGYHEIRRQLAAQLLGSEQAA